MSVLSVRIDPVIEQKIQFLMDKGFIDDKSAFIRRLLDKSLTDEIINLLCHEVEKGEISAWKSAEIAGISLEKMLSELAKRNITLYDTSSLLEDLQEIKDL